MKIAFDENLPMAMVRVFKTFANERQLRKLTGNFDIESAKDYTPAPHDQDFEAKSDVPWIKRFSAAGGSIIISGNTDIMNVPHERLALIECGIITIFFEPKWNNRGFFDKCAMIMHWWPVIAAKVKRAKKGSFWRVPNDWSASGVGALRSISNRDPQELRLERKTREGKLPKRSRSRGRFRPKMGDLFLKETQSDAEKTDDN